MNLPRYGYLFTISLTQNQQTVVDEKDWYSLRRDKWCVSKTTAGFYAVRGEGSRKSQKTVLMHRQIMGLVKGDKRHVDHINHDTLDNRRTNLQIVSARENHENKIKASPYGTGIKKAANRFQVQVWVKDTYYYIGTFKSPAEAQKARQDFLSGKIQAISSWTRFRAEKSHRQEVQNH